MKYIYRAAAFAVAAVLYLGLPAAGQAVNTAGLVIVHSDDAVVTQTVTFEEDTISGTELLRRANLGAAIVEAGSGEAVYAIDGEGDPTGWVTINGKSYYWSFYVVEEGAWTYSSVGAGDAEVGNGGMNAWVWQAYGQERKPPTITIPEMGVTVAAASGTVVKPVENPPPVAKAQATATAGKDNGTAPAGSVYWVFAALALALGFGAFYYFRKQPDSSS
jgi:hypothetical protein